MLRGAQGPSGRRFGPEALPLQWWLDGVMVQFGGAFG